MSTTDLRRRFELEAETIEPFRARVRQTYGSVSGYAARTGLVGVGPRPPLLVAFLSGPPRRRRELR